MIQASRIKCFFLLLTAWAFLMMPALVAQEGIETKNPQPPEKTIPGWPGEETEESDRGIDPVKLLTAVMDKLGGIKGYNTLEDLSYSYRHKHYQSNGDLLFVETASGFNRFEKRLKSRLDFDYPMLQDYNVTLDYREVYGDDGIFGYREEVIIKTPLETAFMGERLLRNNLMLFAPFILHAGLEKARYAGISKWTELVDGKEKEVRCHKVLLPYPEKEAHVKWDTVALYIDGEANKLRRMVIEFYYPDEEVEWQQTYMVDYLERVPVGNVQLPSRIKITVFNKGQLESTLLNIYADFKVNTGLQKIGFEIANQKAGKK